MKLPSRRLNIYSHCSVVVVPSQSIDNFLLACYDKGYPLQEFRGCVNLLGGNIEKEDESPAGILRREVDQEFWKEPIKHNPAPEAERKHLATAILKTASPLQDFLIRNPPTRKDPHPRDALCSCYWADIPTGVFALARKHLLQNRRLLSEGYARIVTLKDLLSGKVRMAHCSALVLSWYLKRIVPNWMPANAIPLGMPRNSFLSYTTDFKYVLPRSIRPDILT